MRKAAGGLIPVTVDKYENRVSAECRRHAALQKRHSPARRRHAPCAHRMQAARPVKTAVHGTQAARAMSPINSRSPIRGGVVVVAPLLEL